MIQEIFSKQKLNFAVDLTNADLHSITHNSKPRKSNCFIMRPVSFNHQENFSVTHSPSADKSVCLPLTLDTNGS